MNSILKVPPFTRIRRHHALEHATLQILSKSNPYQSVLGYSDVRGFWIIGNFSTEAVRDSVEEALKRLKSGESQLAVHPNCGTNYVVAGVLAGSAAWLVMAFNNGNFRRKIQDWPMAVAASIIGILFAQPLGIKLQQRVTTDANPGEMKVIEINIQKIRGITIHRVITRH